MLPLTAFYKCEGKAAGVQYRCIACCARPPKSYECGLCQGGFRRTDRGGTTEVRARKVHLCDTCEVTVTSEPCKLPRGWEYVPGYVSKPATHICDVCKEPMRPPR